jgi:hypothetical protein
MCRISRKLTLRSTVVAQTEEVTMLRSFASAVVLAALISPALADAYWVVQDPSTQKCSIVETKSQPGETPAPPNNAAIGTPFKTQADAQSSIIEMRKCGRE